MSHHTTETESEVLVEGIKQCRDAKHDTVYCNETQAMLLKREVGSPALLSPDAIDDFRIFGLDVEVLPIQRPIVCQKGEVFDLAKDYKNDTLPETVTL